MFFITAKRMPSCVKNSVCSERTRSQGGGLKDPVCCLKSFRILVSSRILLTCNLSTSENKESRVTRLPLAPTSFLSPLTTSSSSAKGLEINFSGHLHSKNRSPCNVSDLRYGRFSKISERSPSCTLNCGPWGRKLFVMSRLRMSSRTCGECRKNSRNPRRLRLGFGSLLIIRIRRNRCLLLGKSQARETRVQSGRSLWGSKSPKMM